MGHYIRPNKPEADKLTIYECGEPTVGSAWVQFDLRFYVVALLFVIFDVEVAFFFPWAVVFGTTLDAAHAEAPEQRAALMQKLGTDAFPQLPGEVRDVPTQQTAQAWAWVAFTDILVFFGVLMVGFAYVWRRGDLDWVRAVSQERARQSPRPRELSEAGEPVLSA